MLNQARKEQRVPLSMYRESWQNWSKYYNAVLPLVSAGTFAVGTIAIVGGVLVFAVPVVGQLGGAAGITAGLASFGMGYGMLAGIGAMGAIAIGSGSGAGAIVGFTTRGVVQVLCSTLTRAILEGDSQFKVEQVKLQKSKESDVSKYMAESAKPEFDSGNNEYYMPTHYKEGKVYYDSVFVQVTEAPHAGLYMVSGMFCKRELIVLMELAQVTFVEQIVVTSKL